MNLILMGPPGAGKGTQAEMMKKRYFIPHISTGDMFREAVSQGTQMGKKAREYMEQGELVPDEVTIGIIEERLSQPDCVKGFILDGFPRTQVQAEALHSIMSAMNKNIDAAINIYAPEEVLVERMSGRLSCAVCKAIYNLRFSPPVAEGICDRCGAELIQRSDDKEETAWKRLRVYMDETSPMLDYYEQQGILYNIDSNCDSSRVSSHIQKILESLK